MSKAQTETMGLAIIVVLLLVIGLIALKFMIQGTPIVSQDSYLSSKANNLANSIIKANVCTGNFEQAIVACCNNEAFCNIDACSLVQSELNNLSINVNEKITSEAFDASGRLCFSVGTCQQGINSGTYNLENGVTFDVKICGKS